MANKTALTDEQQTEKILNTLTTQCKEDIKLLKQENIEFRKYLNSLAPEFEKTIHGMIAGVTELEKRLEIFRWDNLILTNLLIIIHGIIMQKFPALKSDPYYGRLEMLMTALQADELAAKQDAIQRL